MKIEIWQEGYSATGESGSAQLLGTYEADDFDDAVRQYKQAHPSVDVEEYQISLYKWVYSIWGCLLFDNEMEARKHFG